MNETVENTEQPEEETTDEIKKEITDFKSLGLSEETLECLAKNEFVIPTPVQAQSIPHSLQGKDLLVQAQTGSGKTIAYLLPLLERLRKEEVKHVEGEPFSLIVVPTRELSSQVCAAMALLTTEFKPVSLIGGVPINIQKKGLKEDSRVVVGTPGRILDCLRQKIVSFKKCRFYVLDEVDEMFSMGFFEDVRAMLARLPKKKQGMFVSATVSPRVTMLAQSFLDKPENLFVDNGGEDLPPIDHFVCKLGGEATDKPEALCDIIETQRPRSAIIFCNTKSDTELVEAYLRRRGFDARRLNSDLSQKKRDLIMDRIRKQELQFLVATDIAARGIDIAQIELVINYAIHDEAELYVHRTGRTGRAGRSGKAVSLVGPQDFMAFHKVQREIDTEFIDLTRPTEEEVADARLAHLYELLRETDVKQTARDLLVTRKLIKEALGAEDPDESSLELFTSLQKLFMTHALKTDTKSLDEELDAPDERPVRGRQDRGGRDNRGRDNRSQGRSSDNRGRSRDNRSSGNSRGRDRRPSRD